MLKQQIKKGESKKLFRSHYLFGAWASVQEFYEVGDHLRD